MSTLEKSVVTSHEIRKIRERLGLGKREFATCLGLGTQGERTVSGWENGEHRPSPAKSRHILQLEKHIKKIREQAPYRWDDSRIPSFTFIDLFAGIGGIRLPFQQLGGRCVFTSEWDRFAQKTYMANFGELPAGDITEVPVHEIPEHDILLGGFPCQAFSQAGLRQGFQDTRGTMFFEIQKILALMGKGGRKRPRALVLENVKQLMGHNKGETLRTIVNTLEGIRTGEIPREVPMTELAREALNTRLNYEVFVKVLRARDFGAPQNRERVFIVGFDRDQFPDIEQGQFGKYFKWPEPTGEATRVGDILETLPFNVDKSDPYTISDKLWEGHQRRKVEHGKKGNGFGYSLFNADDPYTNTISARYYKDGSEILIDQSHLGKNPRKLTPRECARLQGFPENYRVDAVSHGQIYKQFGNSVCVKVIDKLARAVTEALVSLEAGSLDVGGLRNNTQQRPVQLELGVEVTG